MIFSHTKAILASFQIQVETIGDSYVAVCGLPNPNEKHALMMARFAQACLEKFSWLTKQLENRLGPDTGDLGLRVGLHSGPVTVSLSFEIKVFDCVPAFPALLSWTDTRHV